MLYSTTPFFSIFKLSNDLLNEWHCQTNVCSLQQKFPILVKKKQIDVCISLKLPKIWIQIFQNLKLQNILQECIQVSDEMNKFRSETFH